MGPVIAWWVTYFPANLGSNPGVDTLRFMLGASRLMDCLTAILGVKLEIQRPGMAVQMKRP